MASSALRNSIFAAAAAGARIGALRLCPIGGGWPVAALALALVVLCSTLRAESPPDESFLAGKTVMMIVGMPPGGGEDLYARLVQRHWHAERPGGPPMVVQNVPGAGSLRSVRMLGVSPHDGTTIATFSSSLILEAILAPERLGIDFRKFAFLGNISEDLRVCYTSRNSGIASLADIKSRSDVTFAATANGTSGNIDVAIMRHLLGLDIHQVNGYSGSAEKRLALERGEIDGDCGGFAVLPQEWLQQNKINVLLRLSPTLLPGMDAAVPYGGDLMQSAADRQLYDLLIAPERLGRVFMVAAEVPAERIAALRAAFDRMMADPAFVADAKALGLTLTPMSGAEVDRQIEKLYATPPALLARARDIMGE